MASLVSFAPLFILLLLTNVCVTLFRCPESSDCTCAITPSGDYELLCMSAGYDSQPEFIINIQPGKYVQLQCGMSLKDSDYAHLPKLNVGAVDSFNFRMCPLPDEKTPLLSLLQKLGVSNVRTLLFQTLGMKLLHPLQKKHLQGLSGVTRLVLSGNELTRLSEDLFSSMGNLTWLDLRSNKVELPQNIFQPLLKLEFLELGSNALTNLEPGVFHNLKHLKQLNLWRNNLQNLTMVTFQGVENLTDLDLNSNDLTTLNYDVFSNLKNLSNIYLYSNKFSSLPEGIFINNTKLKVIKLYDNRQTLRTLPKRFLANLPILEEVYLDKCNISEISEDMFSNSSSIKNITLAYNNLETLPRELLASQINLLHLNLSRNALNVIPEGFFANLKKLVILDLDKNKLLRISNTLFNGLKNLQVVRLERNELQIIEYDALNVATNTLQYAFFADNNLSFVDDQGYAPGGPQYIDLAFGSSSPFRNLENLQELSLRNNSLTQIFSDWRLSILQLKMLDLSYNRIRRVTIVIILLISIYVLYNSQFSDIHFLGNSITVDLSNNLIAEIDLHDAENIVQDQDSKNYAKVILNQNPLYCDCVAYNLARYYEGTLDPKVRTIVELVGDNLTCTGPDNLKGIQISTLSSKALVCPLDVAGSKTRNCPLKCTCTVRPADYALIVDCSYAGLRELPDLPSPEGLVYTELHIQGNFLTHLPNQTNTGYKRVKKLHAEYNNLTKLDVADIPYNIEVLELAHNNLTTIKKSMLDFMVNNTHLKSVTLGSNPWQCGCDTRDLLEFLQNNFQIVSDLSNLTCLGKQLSSMLPGELCPEYEGSVIAASVSIAILGLLLGVLAGLYYRYQQEIKVWLFAHRMCLWFVTEEELDKDKIYDAFISYSHKDEEFIMEKLVPELENGTTPYKLCLHYRDWVVGEWIPTQIARSVEDSRRTVVVLSPNFLESVWGRMEFRTAHSNALSEGRARVIIIIYGDIGPTEHLDPELKAYLSMNTYVKWGDPWFWEKLRYALPHPPELSKQGVLTRSKGKDIGSLDDKIELIRPIQPIQNQATTPIIEMANLDILTTKKSFEQTQNGIISNGIVNGGFNGIKLNANAKQSDV